MTSDERPVPNHDMQAVYESFGLTPPPEFSTSAKQHLDWCKERALEELDYGGPANALASITSDLDKHPETAGHPGIALGMMQMMAGFLTTPDEMRKFIEGFN